MKTMLGARATGAAATPALAPRKRAAASPSSSSSSSSSFRGRLLVSNVAVPSRPPTAHKARRSKVEIIKEQSDYLRHPLMEVR
jgi:sulfite reductase (ferredoxin)